MPHFMIDLETLGTTPDAAIIAVGAVKFTLDGPFTIDNTRFYRRVDWASGMHNRRVSADTLKWWMKQPEAARLEVLKNGASLPQVLQDLTEFIVADEPQRSNADVHVWGNGATFDISMLEHAYNQMSCIAPWKFWNVRDCRTLEATASELVSRKHFQRRGTHHNALDDAIYQAEYINAMWNALRNPFG